MRKIPLLWEVTNPIIKRIGELGFVNLLSNGQRVICDILVEMEDGEVRCFLSGSLYRTYIDEDGFPILNFEDPIILNSAKEELIKDSCMKYNNTLLNEGIVSGDLIDAIYILNEYTNDSNEIIKSDETLQKEHADLIRKFEEGEYSPIERAEMLMEAYDGPETKSTVF